MNCKFHRSSLWCRPNIWNNKNTTKLNTSRGSPFIFSHKTLLPMNPVPMDYILYKYIHISLLVQLKGCFTITHEDPTVLYPIWSAICVTLAYEVLQQTHWGLTEGRIGINTLKRALRRCLTVGAKTKPKLRFTIYLLSLPLWCPVSHLTLYIL